MVVARQKLFEAITLAEFFWRTSFLSAYESSLVLGLGGFCFFRQDEKKVSLAGTKGLLSSYPLARYISAAEVRSPTITPAALIFLGYFVNRAWKDVSRRRKAPNDAINTPIDLE